jgi:hypothetical protein
MKVNKYPPVLISLLRTKSWQSDAQRIMLPIYQIAFYCSLGKIYIYILKKILIILFLIILYFNIIILIILFHF